MKKALIIMNPNSGVKRQNRLFADIVKVFVTHDYIPTVLTTTKRGDATEYAEKYTNGMDLVVAIGGDGTFNETVAGLMKAEKRIPIGYIPAGSTNDFARSLHISTNLITAAEDIVNGTEEEFDVGRIDDRYFSYVASFGAFTNVSYSTSQSAKNALGHMAYILNGAAELANIKPIHAKIETEERTFEGNYLLGAITNATSVGGLLTFKKKDVDLNDGLFELLLVKMPKDVIDLPDIARSVVLQEYDTDMMSFTKGSKFKVTVEDEVDWALDGEYQQGQKEFEIVNVHGAIKLMLNKERKIRKRASEKAMEVIQHLNEKDEK